MKIPSVLFLTSCAALGSSCDSIYAEADRDQVQPGAEPEPVTVTVFGERVLLFVEYPPLVRGESARFLAHASVLATGEPVRAGRVTLSIGSTQLVADAPKRDGLFVPEGSVASSGSYAATLVIESEQVEETLELGELIVHASAYQAQRVAEAAARDEPPGAVPFLMEQQWKIELLLAEAGPRSLTRRLVVPAQVRSPEGAEVVVSPPSAGRLLAPASGVFPRTGDVVAADQPLGFVEPALGAAELAQLQALELEFDLESLDIVRALGEAHARLDYATRERERIAKLREHGLATAGELDLAEQNLAVGRSASAAAQATKDALDRLRVLRGVRVGGGTPPAVRFPLASPLGGTIVTAGRLPGEWMQPSDEIFRILDTSRVWVEGQVSEFDLHRVGDSPAASATFAALPGARFDVGASGGGALVLLPTIDTESRTAILRCELSSADGAIKPGMLAELEIATATVAAAVAVPFEAIVMDQGLPTAFVMLAGELFQKRELELGVRDGGWVEVLRGISSGEHVATRGAYIVKLAAQSPASFGAGHAH